MKNGKNVILAIVASEDPTRYKESTVKPEKGKGRKDRPRIKNIQGDLPLYIQ